MRKIFAVYLDVDNLDEVFRGCTLAALTGDATRASDETKAAYGAAFTAIAKEMAWGQLHLGTAYMPALLLASGAVRTATAMSDRAMQADLLGAASVAFPSLLPTPDGS